MTLRERGESREEIVERSKEKVERREESVKIEVG